MTTLLADGEDLDAFGAAVADFADRAEQRLFASDADVGPDGDLTAIPALLDEARHLGLLADAGTTGDDDYGVWGNHVVTDGCGFDLDLLATLGERCAGLAASVHAHGIAQLALTLAGRAGSTAEPSGATDTLAAAFVPPAGVALDPRTHPDAVRLVSAPGGERLQGTSPYVWSAGDPGRVVVAARTGSDDAAAGTPGAWAFVVVDTARPGVRVTPVEPRLGLRATGVHRVDFDAVPVDPAGVVVRGAAAADVLDHLVACDWLGGAAIALGVARRAHRLATGYAAARSQGGRPIDHHAAVRLLLAEASHHTSSLETALLRHGATPLAMLPRVTLLQWAITARLTTADHAAAAVTDSLQVHGGYGYTDDYGLSRRLRDVHTLAARHGSRAQLLLLWHALDTAATEEATP